jgi:hypothetical protein
VSKRLALAALLCLLFLGASGNPAVRGDDEGAGAETPDKPLMERKLEHSQAVLSALAREDFDALGDNADALLKLSEEQWISRDTPEYRAQLKDFWVVLEGIKTAADEENLDGATLAYVQMTLTCVRCHKYLRDNPD